MFSFRNTSDGSIKSASIIDSRGSGERPELTAEQCAEVEALLQQGRRAAHAAIDGTMPLQGRQGAITRPSGVATAWFGLWGAGIDAAVPAATPCQTTA